MIKLLIGQPGIGKTKQMIAHANEAVSTAKGNIIFIDESNESILEIHHDIRYINVSEYPISSSNQFIAFLSGILGTNHDIESVYLDGILNVFIMTPEETCLWLEKIKPLSDKYDVKFEISISIAGNIPDCFASYL